MELLVGDYRGDSPTMSFFLWVFWKDVAFSVGGFAGQCESVENRQGSILASCATGVCWSGPGEAQS